MYVVYTMQEDSDGDAPTVQDFLGVTDSLERACAIVAEWEPEDLLSWQKSIHGDHWVSEWRDSERGTVVSCYYAEYDSIVNFDSKEN
ncbi:hypothetical protein HWB05_gp122 [Streptomyces phage BRock]|uniref:Uncharacterized protein n=1 Tax=Streptomyces phage BRock TaxID=1913591 RepID=A0A1J0GW32_9CAUD|nr:hypothetical protein HWB05_gp122 [Streptomyces phage BRock]APC46384.1 hypothetical protein [Streptomyces phage BRock]